MTNGASNGRAFQIARPTFLVEGEEQSALAVNLLSLLIAEHTAGLYRCEALFANWGPRDGRTDFLFFDRALLDFGKQITVRLGQDTLFEGRVTGMEGRFPEGRPPEIVILVEDRLQDLRMTRRTRAFADASDADVFRRIAGDHGLSADVNLSGPTHRLLAQVNQSDLAFLRERARVNDIELWVDGRNLRARAHSGRNGGRLELSYGDQLREFTVLADLAGQCTGVTVGGWDVAGKQALAAEAGESAISGELNGLRSGASLLREAFGQRKETLAHIVPLAQPEAQAAADAYFRLSARRFVVGQGYAQTRAGLRVGAVVELSRLGPLFDGAYYLTEVRHVFDSARGIRTEFTAERPGLGG